jgi:cell division protein FtsW (lipid II flippase)
MAAIHCLGLRVLVRVLRNHQLHHMRRPLALWIVVGFIVLALGRPQLVLYDLTIAAVVLVMTGIAMRTTADLQHRHCSSIGSFLAPIYIISVWSLFLLLCCSPRQCLGQLLPWLVGWCLVFHPLPRRLVSELYDLLNSSGTGRLRTHRLSTLLWLLAVVILIGLLFHQQSAGHASLEVRLGSMVFQPAVLAMYAALAAAALRLAVAPSLTTWDWMCYAAMNILFLVMKEMGLPGLIFLCLLLLAYLTRGLTGRDCYRLLSIGTLTAFAIVSIAGRPQATTGGSRLLQAAQHRLSHVRHRLAYLHGEQSPATDEMVRVGLAVRSAGLLGLGPCARTWVLGPAASKDYAAAAFELSFGLLGIVQLLVLYICLFNRLTDCCLRATSHRLPARYCALAFLLAGAVETLVPLASHVELLIPVGVPLLALARGGTQLLVALTSLLAFTALDQVPLRPQSAGPLATALDTGSCPPDDDFFMNYRSGGIFDPEEFGR